MPSDKKPYQPPILTRLDPSDPRVAKLVAEATRLATVEPWCARCLVRLPVVAMVFSNPTIEGARESLCALVAPLPLCRACAWDLQTRMLVSMRDGGPWTRIDAADESQGSL